MVLKVANAYSSLQFLISLNASQNFFAYLLNGSSCPYFMEEHLEGFGGCSAPQEPPCEPLRELLPASNRAWLQLMEPCQGHLLEAREKHLAHDGVIPFMHKHSLPVMMYVGYRVRIHLVRYKRVVLHLGWQPSFLQLPRERGEALSLLRAFRAASRAVVVPSLCRSDLRSSSFS